MQSVRGTYENGQLRLEKEFLTKKPVPVIITFLEKVEEDGTNQKPLNSNDFGFAKSRAILKDVKGTPLSEILIEERRTGR